MCVRSPEVAYGTGGWVSVVVWDGVWLSSGTGGSCWSIEWSVGTGACYGFAVNTWWSVVSVTFWELGWVLFNFNWGPLDKGLVLVVVEFLSLHGNILSEIFITVHTGSEEFNIRWSA